MTYHCRYLPWRHFTMFDLLIAEVQRLHIFLDFLSSLKQLGTKLLCFKYSNGNCCTCKGGVLYFSIVAGIQYRRANRNWLHFLLTPSLNDKLLMCVQITRKFPKPWVISVYMKSFCYVVKVLIRKFMAIEFFLLHHVRTYKLIGEMDEIIIQI